MTIRFDPRITLGRAWAVLDDLLPDIAARCPEILTVTPAGDIRRVEPIVNAVVLVARANEPDIALSSLSRLGTIGRTGRRGRRAIFEYRQAQIEVRIAAPEEHGSVLFEATGSPAHVRAVGKRRGETRPRALEEELYADAGLPFIAPELRQGSDEIDAAVSERVPSLVERQHIRGDLHMHSTFSDGQDSMATMVEACRLLGYEYVAITDHSENAGASRTLRAAHVAKQRDEIERLRALYPSMTIFHGVEVDILADGRLDFEDRVLEQFDIVLASLHDRDGQSGVRLTRRCLAAIRNPLVNILAHPSNQLVGRRPGYPLNYEMVYGAAAETGTALEVDGAPSHMDLDGEHARAAAAAGATLVIDSDCHRAVALERQMALGIGTARRGWVEPGQVLNTRSAAQIKDFVAKKRAAAR